MINKEERLRILEALSWAQEHPQQIIYMSNETTDKNEFMAELMSQYGFSDEQAYAIVNIRMVSFTKVEKEKVRNEIQELLTIVENE